MDGGPELPGDVWALVLDATAEDDRFFLAATCRLLWAFATRGCRRLRTRWQACLATEARLDWARSVTSRGRVSRPPSADPFRLVLPEDLYIEACRRCDVAMARQLYGGVAAIGRDGSDVRVGALLAAAGAGGVSPDARLAMCRVLWPDAQEALGARTRPAVAAAVVALGEAAAAGCALTTSYFIREFGALANSIHDVRDLDAGTEHRANAFSTAIGRVQRRVWRDLPAAARKLRVPYDLSYCAVRFGNDYVRIAQHVFGAIATSMVPNGAAFEMIAPLAIAADPSIFDRIVMHFDPQFAAKTLRDAHADIQPWRRQTLLERARHAAMVLAASSGELSADAFRLRDPETSRVLPLIQAIASFIDPQTDPADTPAETATFVPRRLMTKSDVEGVARETAKFGDPEVCAAYALDEALGDWVQFTSRAAMRSAARAGRLDVCMHLAASAPRLLTEDPCAFAYAPEPVRKWAADGLKRPGIVLDEMEDLRCCASLPVDGIIWTAAVYNNHELIRADIGDIMVRLVESTDIMDLNRLKLAILKDKLLSLVEFAMIAVEVLRTGRYDVGDWALANSVNVTEQGIDDAYPYRDLTLGAVVRAAFQAPAEGREWVGRALGKPSLRTILGPDAKIRKSFLSTIAHSLGSRSPAAVDWFRRRYNVTREQLTEGLRKVSKYYSLHLPGQIDQIVMIRAERYLDLIYADSESPNDVADAPSGSA